MFERLTSTLLQRLLQKYFILDEDYDDDNNDKDNKNNKTATSTTRDRRRHRRRSNSSTSHNQMSIWSGFVRWNHLELRIDWINQELRKRGQPFQVVHGHISLLTVSIPWTKLVASTSSSNNSSNSSPNKKNQDSSNSAAAAAVIVIVLDGVHLLVRTDYSLHDDALRRHDQEQRRKALLFQDQQQQQDATTSTFSLLRDMLKNRFKQGMLPHLADQLQIHIRDLHVRLEDAESDPAQPFACGIVLESMHIQNAEATAGLDQEQQQPPPDTNRTDKDKNGDDDDNLNDNSSHDDDNNSNTAARVIHKVSQLNHLGIYWTPLETSNDNDTPPSTTSGTGLYIPVERTLLQNLSKHDIVAALDGSIARRIVTSDAVGSSNSNSNINTMPQHSYLLTPVDATAQADLATTTATTSATTTTTSNRNKKKNNTPPPPPIVALQIQVSSQVTLSIRDDQCLAMLRLRHSIQEHQYRKRYHLRCCFRPQVSVHEDPRAWWQYGLAVIQYELYETRLRWSWHRFRKAFLQRQRYCDLYKQHVLRQQQQQQQPFSFSSHKDNGGSNNNIDDDDNTEQESSRAKEEAEEEEELQAMEDGIIGDLSVRDILLYRILVNKRLAAAGGGDNSNNNNNGLALSTAFLPTINQQQQHSQSWLRRTVSNMVDDDTEAQEEYHRLLSYWQEWPEAEDGLGVSEMSSSSNSIIATVVSIDLQVNQGRLVLYSPLPSTADQKACRRLQERFLDFCYTDFSVNFSLLGDFESVRVQVVLADFVALEARTASKNHQNYTVIQRTSKKQNNNNSNEETASSVLWEEANTEYVNNLEKQQQPPPLLFVTLVKNPPSANDFHTGIHLELQALQITLVPECEWMLRLKALLQPIPQMKKLETFWDDLSMAYINSLATRGLGLVAKAKTAVSEHRNIDLDLMVDCPVLRISDEKGNQLVYDLGRLYIKTEKLAGVANAKLIRSIKDQNFRASSHRNDSSGAAADGAAVNNNTSGWGNGMGFWDDQSTVSQLELQNTWSAASSSANKIVGGGGGIGTAPTPWTTPRRSNNSILGRSFRDFASFADKSEYLEDESGDDQPGGAISGGDAMDDFFYDTYEVQLATGSLKLVFSNENKDCGNGNNVIVEEMCSGVDIVVMLHKSIIPHDSTLYRFKAGCSIEDVEISISETAVIQLMHFFNEWSRILSSNNPVYIHQGNFLSVSARIQITEQDTMSVEENESASVFDGDEFFDAVENNSEASVVASNPMVEDNWIADSESVLESETRSVGRSARSRKRRQAWSDVSSISENSAGMRRRFNEANYLSADNLARLEEKVDEESVAEGLNTDKSEAESFRSAISPGRLVELANDLLLDIQITEDMLNGLRTKLSDFRKNADASKGADPGISTVKRLLRLEMDRTTAELLAMRATHADLTAQIQIAEKEQAQPVGSQASQFAKRASTLLQTRKKRGPAGVEHSLMRNLKRALVQLSISCGSVIVRFRPVDSERVIDSPSFLICIVQSNAVLRQSIGETKLFLSVENLTARFDMKDTPQVLLVGGSVDPYAVNLLPSRFPQFISAATMEDKLLRAVVTFEQGRSREDPTVPFKLVKLRIAFGDVELRPRHSQLQGMIDSLLRISLDNQTASAARRNEVALDKRVGAHAPMRSIWVDVCAQFSSLRLLIADAVTIAGVLTELKTNIIGSFYKDRAQVDVRCGNIQLLHLDDREAEASEVYGKRDSYNPIIRARWRTQKSPAGEAGGWVVCWGPTARIDRPECHQESSDPSLGLKMTWNSHVVVKVDSIVCQISPRILSRLCLCLSTWNDFNTKSMSSYKELGMGSPTQPDHGTLAPSSLSLRWRLDLSVRKSSIVVQTNLHDVESGLILSLGLLAFIQQLGEGREGIAAECTFQEIRLARSGNERWPILETTIIVGAGLIFKSPLCALVNGPHLQIPKEALCALGHDQGRNSTYPEISSVDPTEAMPIALTASVLPLRINITASICSKAKRICQELLHSLTPRRDGKENKVSTSKASGTARLILQVFGDNVSLTLFREGRNSGVLAYPDAMAAFYVKDASFYVQRDELSTIWSSFSLAVTEVDVVDFSCKEGIRVLGLDTSPAKIVENDDLETKSRRLVSIDCQLSAVNERLAGNLDVKLGRIQCLVLPSFVRALLKFRDEFVSGCATGGAEMCASNGKEKSDRRHFHQVSFALAIQSFSLLLSSKDLLRHIRDSPERTVGVVAVRLGATLKGLLTLSSDGELPADVRSSGLFKNELDKYLDGRRSEADLDRTLFSSTEFHAHGFQIVRTGIRRSTRSPFTFQQSTASMSEQRITNQFQFAVKHELIATWFRDKINTRNDPHLSISHGLQVRAGFVDLLLYIAQSSEGMNEALRVSVSPIVQMLKAQNEETSKTCPPSGHGRVELLASGPAVFSVRVEAVQVTLVPGGATRLNQSPIIKFALFRVAGGGAMTTSAGEISSATNSASCHLVLGAWLGSEISASYHNTRLVAWEPVIEPWTFNAQIGVDLTRALKLPTIAARRLTRSLDSSANSIFSPTSGRLADWGRLLRSPFGAGTTSATKENEPRPAETDFDFCFLLLIFAAADLIRTASILSLTHVLPGNRPGQWLRHFGYPTSTSLDGEILCTHPAVMCWLNDVAPLDVNVTGALIDDLWEHVRADGDSSRRAPHWIRNNTGLMLRFEEVLDVDRMSRGEIAAKVVLPHGTEAPLSLKRSLSQSCDPHRAFIKMEIGSYSDTCGRLDLDVPKGTRSSAFSYRIAAKIPVDTVGVQRFPLDLNYESDSKSKQSQAWVIVRVALRGGIKFVSVESPLTIKNISDTDILCEARDHDGLSLIWRYVVPKREGAMKLSSSAVWPVPIPADVASYVHGQSCLFSVISISSRIAAQDESEFPSTNKDDVTKVKVPSPYSRSSLERGVIAEMDIRVPVMTVDTQSTEVRHLNVLSFRVGSLALEHAMKSQRISKTSPEVPEQRLILFRAPLVIRNHLAYPVEIQMRVLSDSSLVSTFSNEWIHLGKLDCGDCLSWSLASPSDKVELRVRIPSPEGGPSRQFPSWSTPTVIPSDRDAVAFGKHRSPSSPSTSQLAKMKVLDSSNVSLFLSACVSRGGQPSDKTTSTVKDVKEYAEALPAGSRDVNIFVPFLVVDGSGLNLEYKCGNCKVAGQADAEPGSAPMERRKAGTLGLGELLDDDELLYLPSRMPFDVTMIGDERSTEIAVRRSISRMHHTNGSPWSNPIYLTRATLYQDTTVLPPGDSTERFALRSRILRAPSAFGGHFGTRLIHIVCRFLVINELGRDIEVASGSHSRDCATVIKADGHPRPFHFYGSEYAFFRLKEYGWQWSGRFNVKKKRKEVTTLRVRHDLKGHTMIVNIEFNAMRSGTNVIVFRVASHAPYRLENNTLLPLHFHQSSSFQSLWMAQRHQEAVILPYHSSDFAWDEPDYGQRSISLRVADFGELPRRMTGTYLGCFRLDLLVPGMDVKLAASQLKLEAKIVADGPTRVLRISEVSEAGLLRLIETGGHQFQDPADHFSSLTTMLHLSFHGLGISVIDWSPRELVYIRLDDILIEQRNDGSKESAGASIAKITVDNQLWVTPYPVALKMGFPRAQAQKRRNRKLNAISLSCVRALGSSTGYNDLLLFEKAELSTQPISIRVDGQLAGLALNMIRQIKRGTASRNQAQTLSRSAVLGRALGMADRFVDSEDLQQLSGEDQLSLFVDDLYEAIDSGIATSSIAAKLRIQYRHPNVARPVTRKGQASGKSPSGQNIQHKVYLEKLKISGLAAELSWNGPVPVHWWIFPSVAFEGLPLSLRPFTISHSYGTMEEHLQSVASHYISVRRGIDLVVGVFWRKPFFLPREIMTYILSSISDGLQASERGLLTLASSTEAESTRSPSMYRIVVDPVVAMSATILHVFSKFAGVSSSLVRHGTVHHHTSGGQVRQRNPRLFAHVDGNDLLVDFQEGENAGKALLSRVRMGLHLGEGYVYHAEGALEARNVSQGWRTRTIAPMTLIVMVTLERILVVKGELDAHFCEVVWETPLSNLVNVEFFKLEQDKTHDLVVLWYLTGTETLHAKDDRPARVLLADAFGLDTLRSRATLVPKAKTETLLKKIASLQSSLLADELIVYQ